MKRAISIILSLCMLLSLSLTACAAEETQNETTIILKIGSPTMTVNGEDMPIDEQGTVPVVVNDRTLLPVRAIVEKMGGTVGWDGETQEVTLKCGEDEIRLVIDSTTAYLNGEAQTLDVAPTVINDRTMLPIRFIAESFKFNVDWNGEEQKVTITKAATAEETTEATTKPEETPSPEQPDESANTDNKETVENKALVVYFSATGNTKALAKTIAETTGADIVEIVPEVPYTSADLNYSNDNCRANLEQNDDSARPAIANKIENIDDYDTIFIGYPIWWGQAPKIIYTFLESYDFGGKTIIPFCTSASSGMGSSATNLHSLAKTASWLSGTRFSANASRSSVASWINSLGLDIETK